MGISLVNDSTEQSQRPRGRFAPSPTGLMHVGNARTALVAWLSIRSQGGTFVWRIEDLDPPRIIPGAAEAAMADLQWLGIDWDEGPDKGGLYGPYVQSKRYARYEAALQHLYAGGDVFPCSLSRKDVRAAASAPHGRAGMSPYPKSLRPTQLGEDWFEQLQHAQAPWAAIRFKTQEDIVRFEDPVYGVLEERVDETVGDFVLKRRDGLYAYQLAVVVDDLRMEIDEVVRGEDLLASTARQIQLIQALDGRVPRFAHVPLVVNANGDKLSKRDASLTLESLRQTGIQPEKLVGYFAFSLGLIDVPRCMQPADLVPFFQWAAIKREAFVLPGTFIDELRGVR